MLTASAKFSEHLTASHRPVVRLGVWTPTGVASAYEMVGYLGVVAGSLTLDYRRNIRRQTSGLRVASYDSSLDTDFATRLDTRDFLEALTSSSAEISVEWGLAFPDLTTEWVTLARLRVEESTRTLNAAVLDVAAAYDGGSRVADFPLITPYAPFTGGGTKLTYVAAIKALVEDAYPTTSLPTWTVAGGVDITSLPPDNTVFTGDRWAAVNALAQAINVTVGATSTGGWTIAPATPSTTPVWTVNHGAGGVLVAETTAYSRRKQYNAVAIRWQNPDGTGGLSYIADMDPTSPTYYNGAFGRKPRPEETLATVTTSGQADAAATTILQQCSGRTRAIALTSVHNPLMEPGDVLTLHLPDGSVEDHVIDAITLPLEKGTMNLETRVLRIVTGATP
jgi:hypothetical protein